MRYWLYITNQFETIPAPCDSLSSALLQAFKAFQEGAHAIEIRQERVVSEAAQ